MAFNIFTGLLTIAALFGVFLNINKDKRCFIVWLFTNATWAVIDFYKGIPMQGLLFTVYTGLAIAGLLAWSKEDDSKH